METDAMAPSTTAGPGFEDAPEPLVLVATEFLCAWEGMRMELRDGLTDNSAKKENKNRLFLQPISLLREGGGGYSIQWPIQGDCPKGCLFGTKTERDSRYD